VTGAEAYLRTKFHLDPSNRLETIHQRHREEGQTGQDSGPIAYGEPFFGATICETVRPMLWDRCLSVCLTCQSCSVRNVGVLWPNGWTDQDEIWHAGKLVPGQTVL